MNLQRQFELMRGVTVGTTTAASSVIKMQNYAGGTIYIDSTAAIDILAWYVRTSEQSRGGATSGEWAPLQDGAGNAITTTVPSSTTFAAPIPSQCFGCGDVIAVDTNGSGGSMDVTLKS